MAKQLTEEEKKAQEIVEALAKNIEDIARGVRVLLDGRLNKRAILLLVSSAAGRMQHNDVERVLDAVASLDKTFLRKQ